MTTRRWRHFYEQVAPVLVLFCLIASLFASVGTFLLGAANDKQDAERAAENRALLTCVSDWADAFTGTLPPIRAATIDRDEALRHALGSFREALVNAGRGVQLSESQRRATLERIIGAFAVYEQSAEDLAQARKAHPYPPSPQFACAKFLDQ